jgi:hypothetical protein
MPLMRLIAENVGPFERLDIDFSDGNGKPHCGPHILAGVNGSGKSTVLRAIAWALSWDGYGFPDEEWKHFLRGPKSRALIHLSPKHSSPYLISVTADPNDRWGEAREIARSLGLDGEFTAYDQWEGFGKGAQGRKHGFTMCAYAPARSLSHVATRAAMRPLKHPTDDCLAFEAAVQNDAIQDWLVRLFSKEAMARVRQLEFDSYAQTIAWFRDALKLVCNDPTISVVVEIEPNIEPRVNFHGKSLNFSQLSDGVRTSLGWLADFMMRQDQMESTNAAKSRREGLLLLDEIDIYLHPKWQRTLLPAMRKALPEVQIIASSHSPFVISSCPDARIHVLELDADGIAHACPPQPAPFGKSVTATLQGIFDVESRFDVQTEADLKEWDNLKRDEAVGKMTPAKRTRLETLSDDLSERSEELRLIVRSPGALQASILNTLLNRTRPERATTRSPKRNGSRKSRSAKLR